MKRKPAARVEISGEHWRALDHAASVLAELVDGPLTVAIVREARNAVRELDRIEARDGTPND